MTSASKCPNLNHRRVDAPARFCPTSGEVVNENIPTGSARHNPPTGMSAALGCVVRMRSNVPAAAGGWLASNR